MDNATVPTDWTPPAWLTIYTRTELQYLAERQDARNRELRQIITQLTARLEKHE